jgi:cell division protein FtsZ
LLGAARLDGQGTGGDVIKGRLAAQDDIENVRREVEGVRTVVIITCLGGGTGAGVTPELLKVFRDMGIVTLCFVTRPFGFEGGVRRQSAERCLPMFEENADTLVVVPLDELHAQTGKTNVVAANEAAARILSDGLTLLWRVLLTPGFVRLDTARLRGMLLRGGAARFGMAAATGDDRATQVVAALGQAPLLRSGEALGSARTLALGVLAGSDLRLAELGTVMERVQAACRRDCQIEMGTVLDARFDGQIELVALTFENCLTPDEVRPAEAMPVDVSGVLGSVEAAGRKGKAAKVSKLGRSGRFRGVEPTLHGGEVLDTPTYQRRNIVLER